MPLEKGRRGRGGEGTDGLGIAKRAKKKGRKDECGVEKVKGKRRTVIAKKTHGHDDAERRGKQREEK